MTGDVVSRSRLIEFAQPVRREVAIDPLTVYRTIGCHLYGEGLYERKTKTGAEIRASRMFLIDKDDLVINRIWAQKGSAGIVPESLAGAVVTQDFPVWALNANKAFPPYIGWYLKTPAFWEECRRHSHGTSGRERLSPKELPNVMFPLPPLDEQRRIVARIEELAALIEEAQVLRAKAQEEARSLHKSALGEVFDSRSSAWRKETVAHVILSMDAGWSPRCESYPAGENEWGVLKTTSVQWLEFQPQENKKLPETLEPRPGLCVEAGDVLVTRAGPRKRVGVVATVRESREYLMISDKLIRLRPDQSKMYPLFLQLALASPFSQGYLLRHKTGLADAQENISQRILRATPVVYPSLAEQRRLVAYLDGLQAQLDELTALLDATEAELDALLPSVLDQAFRGEL